MEQMANRAQTIVADTLIAAGAFFLAYILSSARILELGVAGLPTLKLLQLIGIYAALAAVFSTIFRRELSPWRYVSIPDALVLTRTAFLTAGVFLLAVFVMDRADGLPRSALAMAVIFQMVGCMGARIVRRALHEHALDSFAPLKTVKDRAPQAPSLLLIGPPSLADSYLRDVARRHDHAWTPVGIVGPDARDVGQQVRGVCVIESLDNLDAAMTDLRRWNRYPRAILFLDEPGRLRGLTADQLGQLKNDGIRLLRLPSIVELAHQDGMALLPMREISVEELLARDPIELDRAAVGALIRGRRVLITGAGGSIGAELCRQVAAFQAAHVTMMDFSETSLFEIDREMTETWPALSHSAVLCDVRNARRLEQAFRKEKPHLVFHAAALKHVSMVERHPCEGVLTNVVGTWNVAEAAKSCGAAQMVLISTDKAVDPSNVMGATKRLAEAVIQAQQAGQGTRFSAVRFGNVLGSAGSVVPIFKSQIDRGGPVTVTHEEIERFFMTIPEAAQLVLHATATCAEDEESAHARLFLLEMGEPVRIMDLARQMIALSGRIPGKDIDIEITGLRPGEKLTEALLDETERSLPCAPKVMEVVSSSALRITSSHLVEIEGLAEMGDVEDVRRALFDLVGQIRGEKAGAAPTLRVVANG
ncbi:MAG: nucleoside-diphosphate sugar epimerase/dehydratase [Phenylobacterium sp.]|uniref:polysaccharide biosynthesis protein n=1 Tax=Phenylobacterium sp. TaxID=1871053 RepID=UPI0027373FFD|nr:nucleoside-diphosphate sugar epimerase/dehydratase [Phenylobacterium sp.]MDP3748424.1 nucleoside-diphosphate sugar epimerase/dehydratase [Phenylobacterium sp.]